MKKETLFSLLRLVICLAATFVFIYLIVLLWGWNLFESGDPILTEIGVSVIIGAVVFIFNEICLSLHKRVENLEKRLEKLEDRNGSDKAV